MTPSSSTRVSANSTTSTASSPTATPIPCLYLYEQNFEWFEYQPKRPFLVLDKVYPEGVFIPKALVGLNMVHLPTVKTHVFTTITGAMKNAFGGLLHRNRHWTHAVIHDTLVDLLMIQQEIHPGLFAVMDGTFAGDGPGPRAMRWHEKDILLASADQVAIDAVSARLQGFDPMQIRFIRRAHELGLGVADPSQIQIVGYDIEQEPAWDFVQEDTFASRGQKHDLPRPAQAVREAPAAEPAGAVVVLRQQLLSQRLLVPVRRAQARRRCAEDALGPAVPQVRRRQGRHAGHGAEDGCAGGGRRGGDDARRRGAGRVPPPQRLTNLRRRLLAGLAFGFVVLLGPDLPRGCAPGRRPAGRFYLGVGAVGPRLDTVQLHAALPQGTRLPASDRGGRALRCAKAPACLLAAFR